MLSCRMRLVSAVCSLLVVAAAARATEDKLIMYKNNEARTGVIKKADLDGIALEVTEAKTGNKATLTVPASDIASIEWDTGSKDYLSGINNFDAQHYLEAARDFQTILGEKEELDKFRGVAKCALYYFYAESLYRAGRPTEAVPAFEKLMADFKNSYYVPLALGSMVDAAIVTKQLDLVPPRLAQLRSLGNEQKCLADYFEGQALFAQDKIKDADAKFAAAAGSSNVPSTKGMALMGQAKCAIRDNNQAKGRDLAQRALAAGAPREVAGAAHLVIGDAIIGEIDAQKLTGEAQQTKLMDALLEYMRVLEQYRGDVDSEAAAILHAGDCLSRLSKLPNRGADLHRANYMYTKLTQDSRYRNTRWAGMAEAAMKNVNVRR